MYAHVFALFGTLFQLLVLGVVLGVAGWHFRNFLVRRAESRQNARIKEVAAMMKATRSRQRTFA